MKEKMPECTIKEMNEKIQKIENTLYGNDGKDIVSRITSKIDTESLQNKLTILIVLGVTLIVLVAIGIFLLCYFQGQLADTSDLSNLIQCQ